MIAVALLALALYVPGVLYPPSDVSHTIFRLAVCLAVAQGVALPRGRLVRWGLALWAAGVVWSVVSAPDPWRAVWSTANRQEGAWQVSHYIGLTLVAAAVPRERLVRWLAIAAGLSAAWGLAPLGWVNGRLAGAAGNPLYLAPLLLMGGWAAYRAGGRWRALLPFLALAAALSGSKGVIVALVAAAGIWLLHRYPRAAIVAAIAISAVVWVVPISDSGLMRVELGRVALRGIVAHPLGWGAEGYPRVWDAFWSGVAPTGEAWHDRAHCLILDRAIEWGLVGLAGWAMVVVAAWRRAALPERMAIAAYLGYSLTMFEMMWGAAGFAVVLGYCLGEAARPSPYGCQMRYVWRKRSSSPALVAAILALVVGAAQLAQSQAAHNARTLPEMAAAIDRWSPVGGDLVELYLKAPQTATSLEWAADHVELWSPHATQQAFLLAAWDRRYCVDLRAAAPSRPDVAQLCP